MVLVRKIGKERFCEEDDGVDGKGIFLGIFVK